MKLARINSPAWKYSITILLFVFYIDHYYDYFYKSSSEFMPGFGILLLSAFRYRYAAFCAFNLIAGFVFGNSEAESLYIAAMILLVIFFFFDLYLVKHEKQELNQSNPK